MAIEVKDTAHTSDGKGVVTNIDDRYVSVDLENGQKGIFGHRDIFMDEKFEKPAIVNPPAPVVAPLAPVEETPAETPVQ